MLKYLSKFAMDILPSVVATILGAYIVNHYIAAKPGTNAPVAAAVVSSVGPKTAASSVDPKKKSDIKSDATVLDAAPDMASIPGPGIRAKGISEKTILERSAAEKPAVVERPVVVEKPAEKSADKPTETASIPVETRRPQPAPREKFVAKPAAPSVQSPASVAAPVVAAPNTVGSVETVAVPEERRDANDLARAAIERLRGTTEAPPRAQEAARAPETTRVVSAPPLSGPSVRPLPPPIMISTPASETYGAGPSQARGPYAPTGRIDDPQRPTPPADIPDARPLDLRAEAVDSSPAREHTTVAQDVLSAAKSVFHAVLPK
jgi:hypothetical protein